MPLLGAHMSVAGGLHLAFARIREVGGEALQIFTRNQRQWRARPIAPEERRLFLEAWKQCGPLPVASHDSYLINLASPQEETAQKSMAALGDELRRCAALAIPYLVMHPGAHLGSGAEAGISRVAANLDTVFRKAVEADEVMVLLETTAGQGSSLGATFAELAAIIGQSRHADRLGVCFDTCHVFAAGYDLRNAAAYEKTMAEFESQVGLGRLKFFHLNDSLQMLGGRVDRHTHIGAGQIGREGFRLLLNDPRFRNHPMTLETPKGEDLREDKENLALLRGLIAQSQPG
ncbi:deoxyribonuclease IV [Thiovibrio sp. JS02]